MQKTKLGILVVFALIALVSGVSALPTTVNIAPMSYGNGYPGPNSYFHVNVLSTTPAGDPDLSTGWYDGMCMRIDIAGFGSGNPYKVYDSRKAADIAQLPDSMPTYNWKKVNWIANNLNADWRITQAAIWRLDGAAPNSYPENWVMGNPPSYTYHGALPINSLDSYWPQIQEKTTFQPLEWYAVILLNQNDPKGQPIVIRVQIPEDEHQAPEFPTLALPVAMLIGVAGVVEYIRTKKE